MRKVMTKIVSLLIVLTMILSTVATVGAQYPNPGYWANEAISFSVTNGLLQGREDGSMDSEAYLTRAEMAAIIVRAFGATVKADVSKYSDLIPSAWYYDEFAKAVQMRVFEGDGTGRMYPDNYITREEVFTVVARAMVLSTDDHSYLDKFGDKEQISSWAKDYISIFAAKKYVNGDNLGNVNPKANIKRAEFAQLMFNMFKTFYSKTGSYKNTAGEACVMINTKNVSLEKISVNGDLVIGDGADLGTITLKNVKIEGRLLVRGAATVKLINTTVGENVVVNNYNSVVHFDNYRDEKVFDDIVENTEATFKKRGISGGGGASPSVTQAAYIVEHYQQRLDDLSKYDKVDVENLMGDVDSNVTATVKSYQGFKLNTSSVISGKVKADGSLVISVYYDREEYEITFDGNGYTDAIPSIKALYGEKITAKLPNIIRPGYVLNGWYDGTTLVDANYIAKGSVSLKADWDEADAVYVVEYYTQNLDNLANYSLAETKQFPSTTNADVTADTTYAITGFAFNSSHPSNNISGKIPATGTLTLKVYYDRQKYTYTVKHYKQKLDDINSYNEVVEDREILTGYYEENVTATPKNYTGFVVNNALSFPDGKVNENGNLVLMVCYDRGTFGYSIKHFKQNVEKTAYEEVTADTVVSSDIFEKEITATAKSYEGFTHNSTKSVMKGIVNADGSLALEVYYDRNDYEYTVKYFKQRLDDLNKYDEVTADAEKLSAAFENQITVTPKDYTGFDAKADNVLVKKIPANNGLVFEIYYDREEYEITFDGGNNYTGPAIAPIKVVYGENIYNKLPTIQQSGYLLDGWYDQNGNKIDENYVAEGPLALKADLKEGDTYYKVIYYTQNLDGVNYTAAKTVDEPAKTAANVTADTGYYIEGFAFDAAHADNVLTGTVPATGTLVLTVYYKRLSYGYTVKHWKQNDQGTYDLAEEEPFTDLYEKTVKATAKNYDGYFLNNAESGTVKADNSLVLNVYYDLTPPEEFTVTFYDMGMVQGTATVVANTTVSPADFPAIVGGDINYYVKDSSISAVAYPTSTTHVIKYGWWYEPTTGKWEEFTSETKVVRDTDVHVMSPRLNVRFYLKDKDLEFPFFAYYSPDTRFVDTVKDILYGRDGTKLPLKALKDAGYWDTVREKLASYELINSIDPSNNILMQIIPIKFVKVIGEDKLEDYIIDSAKEMFGEGNNTALRDAFVTYMETAYGSGDPEKAAEIKNMMVNTIDHISDTDPQKIKDLCNEILEHEEAFEAITGYKYKDLPTDVRAFAVEFIVKMLKSSDSLFNDIVKEYTGKEFGELPKDPVDLVVEVVGGSLDDMSFLKSVIKDVTGVEVDVTNTMTIKELFVKVAEVKLSEDQFLEDAIKEVLGDDITVSIKDGEGNYKNAQDYIAEIAVAKLGADNALFADVVKTYLKTELPVGDKTIRQFFIEVVKEDLQKADSTFLSTFVKEFTGHDIAISDTTTTKEFFVTTIMAMLESDNDLFADAIKRIAGTSITVEGKTMIQFFTEVVVDKIKNDDDTLDAVMAELGIDTTVGDKKTKAFFIEVIMDELANNDELFKEVAAEFGISADLTGKTMLEVFTEVAVDKIKNDPATLAKSLEMLGLDVPVDDSTTTKGLFKEIILQKLADETDNTVINTATEKELGFTYDDLALTAVEESDARLMIAKVIQKKLESDSQTYEEIHDKFVGKLAGALEPVLPFDYAFAFIGVRLFNDDHYYEKLMGEAPSADETARKTAISLYVEELYFLSNDEVRDLTGFDIDPYDPWVNEDITNEEAFISLLVNEIKENDAGFEEFTGYAIEDVVDDNGTPVKARDFIVNLADNKLNGEQYLKDIVAVADLGFTVNNWEATAKETIADIAEQKLTDTSFRDELAGTLDFPTNIDWTNDAKDEIFKLAEDKLNDDEAYLISKVSGELEFAITVEDLSKPARNTIAAIAENKITSDETFRNTMATEVGFPTVSWNADAKTEILRLAEDKLNDDSDSFLAEAVFDELGYDLAALDTNAKKAISFIAEDKLTNADADYLNKTITKLGYTFTISDWNGKAKDAILGIAESELKADSNKLETEMVKAGIDITVPDWNKDAKTVVIDIAKTKLNDEAYLNTVVSKLDLPASLTDDWNANAVEELKAYANDNLTTNDDYFFRVTGYHLNEVKGKSGKEVLLNMVEKQLGTNDDLFETATGWKVSELPATAKEFIAETVMREIEIHNSPIRHMIEEQAVEYLLTHHDDLEKAADLALEYLGDHPEERNEIVDTIINELYRADLDKLIYQLKNDEQFEINANTEFIAEGLKIKLEQDYNYEKLVGSRLPEKLLKIYPEQKIIDIYNEAYGKLIAQIDNAITEAKAGRTAYIDTGVTISFNPVDDVYVPLYERALELIKEKGPNNKYYYYYDENIYLQELIKLFSVENIFEGSVANETETLSGYKLRSLDYYYDLLIKLAILGDDAMTWYTGDGVNPGNITAEELEVLTDRYEALVLKYVNASISVAERYAADGTLPNQKLSPIEQAIKDRKPELIDRIVEKYTSSRFYNKDVDAVDYQKVQDAVKRAFTEVNMTTDEFFDKALSEAVDRVPERFDQNVIKNSDDSYTLEAKDNTITLEREVK